MSAGQQLHFSDKNARQCRRSILVHEIINDISQVWCTVMNHMQNAEENTKYNSPQDGIIHR